MLTLNEAYDTVINAASRLQDEHVELSRSAGRVLAEDILCDIEMPPFDKSAMDGYACRREDLSSELEVIEVISAGCVPKLGIKEKQCSKIMTGAMIPEGADYVVKVEDTELNADGKVRVTGFAKKQNICFRGEDIKPGDMVQSKGAIIRPQHIAVLATAGYSRPLVSCRPKVAVIATGNELVEPDQKPGISMIRNSNSYQLCAQVEASGSSADYIGIAPDDKESTDKLIQQAADTHDVILVSGGVSMGDFDLVPDSLKHSGFDLIFEKVLTKPGMPTVFGISGKGFCFGLPGNPVSTFIIFELLVKPFLYKMMGHDFRPDICRCPTASTIGQKRKGRDSWMPAIISPDGTVTTVEYHGSGHISSLTEADGLICIPSDETEIEKGSVVDVRLI